MESKNVFTLTENKHGWEGSFAVGENYKAFSVIMWSASRRGFTHYQYEGKVSIIPKKYRREIKRTRGIIFLDESWHALNASEERFEEEGRLARQNGFSEESCPYKGPDLSHFLARTHWLKGYEK